MKRLTALGLLLVLLLAALPALAEMEITGPMEVVNCNEWVSLREEPRTSALRLAKVSLGAVVYNCQRVDDEWICAESGGCSGYILARYLQPCDGPAISAMMITADGGAAFYPLLHSEEPMGTLPADTVVRNGRSVANGRVWVEWGSIGGFINGADAQVYSGALPFPQRIVLFCNPTGEEPAGPLQVAYPEDFPLDQYDYGVAEYASYRTLDEDIPGLQFVLHTEETLRRVQLFDVSLLEVDGETDGVTYEAVLQHMQDQLDPEHPLLVGAVMWGDLSNLAVAYEDAEGSVHFAFVEMSGEDGSLMLLPF